MALLRGEASGLIGGVSRQDPAIRMSSQVQESINQTFDPAEGPNKRPPTRHIAKMTSSAIGDAHIHKILRDGDEEYLVYILDGDIRVFDAQDGSEKTVTFATDAEDYLEHLTETMVPAEDFAALTIADTTYITNKRHSVAMGPAETDDSVPQFLAWVRRIYSSDPNGDNGNQYKLQFRTDKDSKLPDWETVVQASTGSPPHTTKPLPSVYAGALHALSYSQTGEFGLIGGWNMPIADSIKNDTFWGTYDEDKPGAKGHIWVEGVDDYEGLGFVVVQSEIQRFEDLPPRGPEGYHLKVSGDDVEAFDDYYVELNADGNWVEARAKGLANAFDADTMPHVLVRQSDGTFTFGPATWDERLKGDATSLPEPSFVGNPIEGMVLYKDRLCFMSGGRLITSQAQVYSNFWPTTATSVLDDFPIDVEAVSKKGEVVTLHSALPLPQGLLLESGRGQFLATAGDLLFTGDTVSVDQQSSYTTLKSIEPIMVGERVYWASTTGNHSDVWEYNQTAEGGKAIPVSQHIAKYIPGRVTRLVGNANEGVIIALTDADPKKAYHYTVLQEGAEKLQSAWGTWEFAEDILSVDFFDDQLVFSFESSDGVHLEHMNVKAAHEPDLEHEVRLDRKVELAGTYDPNTDLTTFTLPYAADPAYVVVAGAGFGDQVGETLSILTPTPTSATVEGDVSADTVFFGLPYMQILEPSEAWLKSSSSRRGVTPLKAGRTQIRNWDWYYSDSGPFQVEVYIGGQLRSVYHRDPYLMNAEIGPLELEEGNFRVDIGARNTETRIRVLNDSHYPCVLTGYMFEAQYYARGKAIR